MYIYMYNNIYKKIYPPVKAIAPTWEDGRMMVIFFETHVLIMFRIYIVHVCACMRIHYIYIHIYIHDTCYMRGCAIKVGTYYLI